MKPGYKSTEAWFTLLALVGGMLIARGVIDQTQLDTITEAIPAVANAITQLIGVGAALYAAIKPLIEYIKARTELKSQEL